MRTKVLIAAASFALTAAIAHAGTSEVVSDYCATATGVTASDMVNPSASEAFLGVYGACCGRVRDGCRDCWPRRGDASRAVLGACLFEHGLSPQRQHWNRPTEVIIKKQ